MSTPPLSSVLATQPARLQVESFFDSATSTWSHLVLDRSTLHCALIDSVLDFDARSGRTATTQADRLVQRVRELGASVQWLLETHVHADHLSAAPYLQSTVGGRLAIGRHITQVQKTFGALFNAGPDFATDGSAFDQLFDDGEAFAIGSLQARVMHTPGHTPACLSYLVGDGERTVAFVGDTLFMPDYGSARCDFPGGDATTLYRSIQRVLALPGETELFLCHDYPPDGREPQASSTVADQRANNVHVHEGISEAHFVSMRQARDATLAMPQLLLPSVQVNMRGGHFPPPEDNGVRYLKLPLNAV
jgi:glyoxylase-like metal-dependent hydrolase (beta-lactamase superfamily II)